MEQSLDDTEAAICHLFLALPHVDVIDLKVLEPSSENVMIEGTVNRSDVNRNRTSLSVKMRLMQLGVNYRLVDSEEYDPDTLRMKGV
jgi:hypothetical protein